MKLQFVLIAIAVLLIILVVAYFLMKKPSQPPVSLFGHTWQATSEHYGSNKWNYTLSADGKQCTFQFVSEPGDVGVSAPHTYTILENTPTKVTMQENTKPVEVYNVTGKGWVVTMDGVKWNLSLVS